MANSENKRRASFNPGYVGDMGTQPEESPEQEMIIDNLLGPGVTIIGSRAPVERIILQEQMALAIATGDDFLRFLETHKSEVIYIVHGAADMKAMNVRLKGTGGITVRSGITKLSHGGMRELEKAVDGSPELKVIFLGEFDRVKSGPEVLFDRWKRSSAGGHLNLDVLDKQAIRRDIIGSQIEELRNFAVRKGVSVVVGTGLSTKGSLYDFDALGSRDTEIHVWKVRDTHQLEVLPGSPYVPAMTWDLVLDYNTRMYLLRDEMKKQAKELKGRDSSTLPLTDNEKIIIDAMWDRGYMRLSEIEKLSGLGHSTASGRLDALQKKNKGEWVFKVSKRDYVVNQFKTRDWVK